MIFEKSVVVPAKRTAVDDGASTSSIKKTTVQQKLTFFIRKDTREELATKLAAVDWLSINAITKSEFIRQSFSEKGFVLPKNPSDVMGLVHTQYFKVAKNTTIMQKKIYQHFQQNQP